MKLQITVVLLTLVVFGVGWTSRAVLDGDAPVLASAEDCGSCRRDSRRSHGSPGPYLSTVDKLQEDLGLTSVQHDELQYLIRTTSEMVARNDEARRDIYRRSGQQVRALLTEEQMARLSCIVSDRMDQYRWRRIRAAEDYCRVAGLAPDVGRQVVDALAEYEQSKIELYTQAFLQLDPGAGQDCAPDWSEVHARYQERMDALLDASQRDALRTALQKTCETPAAPVSQ